MSDRRGEYNQEIEDSVLRQQAQNNPTEMTRHKTYNCDRHLADQHQDPTTRIKDESVDISKMSSHSAPASTTCSKLGEDTSLFTESIHRSDDERGEQGTKQSQVVK